MAQEDQKLLNHREKVETLLPHFLVAGVFVIFLFLNFLYYRRNNVQKYQRKIEKRAQELMSFTPRRITSMMRYSECLKPSYKPPSASSNRGSKTELNGHGPAHPHLVASAGSDGELSAAVASGDAMDNERDCASARHASLPAVAKGNDYKPRPRYSLPPLMFASPSRNKHNKQRREMDIL